MKLPFALARRFVAGETLDQALPVVDGLLNDGLHVTLDLLGEDVTDRAKATALTDTYVALLQRLSEARRGRVGTGLVQLLRMPVVMRGHGRGPGIGVRTGDDRYRAMVERGHEAGRSKQTHR